MRLRQLDCFIRVCEVGSITRAAADLHIAQPALGLQIRGLEHEFGASLLDRSSRGVTATPAGEMVLAWARTVRHDTDALKQRLREMAGGEPPRITVALTPSLTNLLAATVIEAVRDRIPGVRLMLIEGLSHSIAEWVETGRADIGVACGTFRTRGVAYEPIMRERLFFVSAPSGEDGPIALGDVLAQPLALPAEFNSIRQAIETAARSIDMPVIGCCEIASPHAGLGLARRGIAESFGPWASVAGVDDASVSVRIIHRPIVERTLSMLSPDGREPGRHEAAVRDVLRETLDALIDRDDPLAAYAPLDGVDGSTIDPTPLPSTPGARAGS